MSNNYGNSKGPILSARSRRRANVLLSRGADPTDELFTKHHNYHIKRRALLLNLRAGNATLPTDEKELTKLLTDLHIKPELVAQYVSTSE